MKGLHVGKVCTEFSGHAAKHDTGSMDESCLLLLELAVTASAHMSMRAAAIHLQ